MQTATERLAFLGLGDGHESQVSGLHPRLQTKFEEAQSIIREVHNGMSDHHLSDIGLSAANEGVADAFFAAIDRTGQRAHDLGYTPRIVWTSPRVDRYEIPGAVIVSVASTTSARAALVWVDFLDVDAGGYGDWSTASAVPVGIYQDLDDAHEMLTKIQRALNTLKAVLREMDRTRSEASSSARPAPAF